MIIFRTSTLEVDFTSPSTVTHRQQCSSNEYPSLYHGHMSLLSLHSKLRWVTKVVQWPEKLTCWPSVRRCYNIMQLLSLRGLVVWAVIQTRREREAEYKTDTKLDNLYVVTWCGHTSAEPVVNSDVYSTAPPAVVTPSSDLSSLAPVANTERTGCPEFRSCRRHAFLSPHVAFVYRADCHAVVWSWGADTRERQNFSQTTLFFLFVLWPTLQTFPMWHTLQTFPKLLKTTCRMYCYSHKQSFTITSELCLCTCILWKMNRGTVAIAVLTADNTCTS